MKVDEPTHMFTAACLPLLYTDRCAPVGMVKSLLFSLCMTCTDVAVYLTVKSFICLYTDDHVSASTVNYVCFSFQCQLCLLNR